MGLRQRSRLGYVLGSRMGWYVCNRMQHTLPTDERVTGPISLLVVSRSPQISELHDIIAGFVRTSGIDTARISVHLLQLHSAASDIPNAFLNLARLFAPTSSVLLVPGTHRPLTLPFPSDLHTPSLVLSANDTYSAATERDDVLAPVFLPRAHDVWCTERFFSPASPDLAPARSADWSACLWQLHLDSLGGMGTVRTPSWHSARAAVAPPTGNDTLDVRAFHVQSTGALLNAKRKTLSGRDPPSSICTIPERVVRADDQAARDTCRSWRRRGRAGDPLATGCL